MQTKLIAIRKLNGDTQSTLAKKLNITNVSLHNKEVGKTDFKLNEAFKIANFYNKTIEEIFINE